MNWKHIVLIWALTTVSNIGAGVLIWMIMKAPLNIKNEIMMPETVINNKVNVPEIKVNVPKTVVNLPAPIIKENITEIVKDVYLVIDRKIGPVPKMPIIEEKLEKESVVKVEDPFGEKLPSPKGN